jgi:hypothetical protein
MRKFLFVFFTIISFNSHAQYVSLDLSGNYNVSNSGSIWQLRYRPLGETLYTLTNPFPMGTVKIKLNPFLPWEFSKRYLQGSSFSEWSLPLPYNTEYASISKAVGYTYNFDADDIIEGWRGYQLTTSFNHTYSSGSQSDYLKMGTVGESLLLQWQSGYQHMIVSPKIIDLSTDKKISIWANNYQGNYTIKLGTLANPFDPTTFTELKSVQLTGQGFKKIDVFFNNYNGVDQYFAIKSSGISGDVYFDDFSYEQFITCFDPSNVTITPVNQNSALLNFQSDDEQTTWELQIKNLLTNMTTSLTINENPYLIENLVGEVNYEMKLRANCAEDYYSNWSPQVSFSMPCESIEQGYQTSFLEVDFLDPCWSVIANDAYVIQAPNSGNTNIIPRTGNRYIKMIGSASPTQKSFLISPYIDDLSSNKRIKFYLVTNGYGTFNESNLIIGTMSNPNNSSTFVPIKVISPLEMNEINGFFVNDYWKEHIVDFSNYNSNLNHHYIALKQGNTTAAYFHIDDFSYEVIPNCVEAVNLTTLNTKYNYAHLNWGQNNVQNLTHWELEYGPVGFIPGTGVGIILTSENNYLEIISNLIPDTEYNFYVRSKCGELYSSWSDKGFFKTRCFGVEIDYMSSFENEAFENQETCFSRLTPKVRQFNFRPSTFINFLNGGSLGYPTAYSGSKFIFINENTNSPETDEFLKTILVSPRLIGLDNNKLIKFWAYIPSNPYSTFNHIEIGTLDDPNDYLTFQSFKIINQPFVLDQWIEIVVDFSDYYGDSEYVGIRIKSSNSTFMFIDNFEYVEAPCVRPTNLNAVQSSENAVTLTWNSNLLDNSENQFMIEYGLSGFATGTGTTLVVNEPVYTISGLQANEKYQFRVRNLCENSVVNWSLFEEFKICCSQTIPFTENFDQYTSSFNFFVPTNFCWTVETEANTCGLAKFYLSNINSSPNSAHMDISADFEMLISPYLSNFDNNKRIKFWLNHSLYGVDTLELLVGTVEDPLDHSTFELYQSIPISMDEVQSLGQGHEYEFSNYGKEVNLEFSNYIGNDKFIAFAIGGVDNNLGTRKIYLDNILIDEIPNCYEPLNIEFNNIDSNSVLINWENTSQSAVEIRFGLENQPIETYQLITTNNSEYLISNLLPESNYLFYFKSICTNEDSLVVGPKRVTTPCNSLVLPWSEGFNNQFQYGVGKLPTCFKINYGTLASYNSPVNSNSNYFEPTNIMTGNGDTTFLHISHYGGNSNYGTIISTPPFNLTAGTTYTFSLDVRKAYEYATQNINVFTGRGTDFFYMESILYSTGIMSEYNFNTFYYDYTPIESGNYSFLLFPQADGGVNMLVDNLVLEEGYPGTVSTNSIFNFSGNTTNLIFERTPFTQNSIETIQGNQLVHMKGSSSNDSTLLFDWNDNQKDISKLNFKILQSSDITQLYLKFNLKQTFSISPNDSRFRVVINGNVEGSEILPQTQQGDLPQSYLYDLSSYIGEEIKVSLQHIGRNSSNVLNSAYLDDLEVFTSLAVNEINNDTITLVPNPTDGLVNIYSKQLINDYKIFTIGGQLLMQNVNTSTINDALKVDISSFSAGIYFIRINTDVGNKTFKVIKN